MWILHEACLNFWPPKSCLVRPPIWNPHLSQPVPWLDSQFLEAIFKKNVLESASSSFCPLVLAVPLEPVWQPSCSFRWQTMFSLVHVGTCCTDTPMLLTSFGGVLWNYLAVWFKIRQANPMAYTLCSFFFLVEEKNMLTSETPPEAPASPCFPVSTSTGAVLSHAVPMLVPGGLQCQNVALRVLSAHISFVHLLVCVCVWGCGGSMHSLWQLVLSFYHLCSGDWTKTE